MTDVPPCEAILDRVYQKMPDIVTRQIADQTILVPIKGKVADMQRIFMLNAVANFIWDQLSGEHSLNHICCRVEETFTVSPLNARQDACQLIERLIDLELISESC